MLGKIWRVIFPSRARLIFNLQTNFNNLQIVDKGQYRYLVFCDKDKKTVLANPETCYQSYCHKFFPWRATPFTSLFLLAPIFTPSFKKILSIGLGAGNLEKNLLYLFPKIKLTTVEIDPEIIKIARRYFKLKPRPNHQIVVADGRKYLEKTKEQFDIIFIDAFGSRYLPGPLFTKEFFVSCKKCLSPNGLLSININSSLKHAPSKLFKSIYRTATTSFPTLFIVPRWPERPEKIQNILLFATVQPLKLDPKEVELKSKKLPGRKGQKEARLYTHLSIGNDTPIITDSNLPSHKKLDIFAPEL